MAGDKSILLIEDDREIASTIQDVLQAAGYRVMVANNGVDGRRIIDNDHPALVITDMMMPKMGGFPVLEHIRSQPSPPRVIMITANEGGRHKAYAEMLGVDEYLRKPFAMDVLLEAVERIIGSGEEGGTAGFGRLATQADADKTLARHKCRPHAKRAARTFFARDRSSFSSRPGCARFPVPAARRSMFRIGSLSVIGVWLARASLPTSFQPSSVVLGLVLHPPASP